jgi:hypothetical protein
MLVGMSATSRQAAAAMNILSFSSTSLAIDTGPDNPANGAVTIASSNLTAGDTIVCDVLVSNTSGTTGDNWGAVLLNEGGFYGLTSARFGVLVRTGTGSTACQVYTNGAAGADFPGSSEVRSNRLLITLYVAATGSTTNLGWKAQLDQGLTGSFTSTLSGTNLTFPGNSISLTFSAYQAAESFLQNPTVEGLNFSLTDTNLLAGASEQSVMSVNYATESNVPPIFTQGFAYSSSNTNVATITSGGLVQAQGNGTATVGVTYYTFSASQIVTVTNVSGTLLDVRLVVTNSMLVGGTQQAGVRGDFANVSDVDLLSYGQPTLTLGNSNFLMVSTSGLITGIGVGTTTLSASYGGMSATQTITVAFPTNLFIFNTFGDGFWSIVNEADGGALAVNSTSATDSAFSGASQEYELLYNLQNSTFRIRQWSAGQCIGPNLGGSAVGTPVTTLPHYAGVPSQLWYLVNASGGYYRIENALSGLVMQSDNGSPPNITMQNVSTNTGQNWSFVYQTHYPKKGMAGGDNLTAELGLNWFYNYNDNTTASLPYYVDYVPMIYSAQYWEPLSDAQSRDGRWVVEPQPAYLLAYNEPDNASQSDTTTNAAIALWPQIEALNIPLVAPATQDTEDAWETDFFDLISSDNYRVDYTSVHEYVPPNAASLLSDLDSVYTTYGRPVWLTEFSPVDWDGCRCWSEDDDYNFLAEFMWQAENSSWLMRYAVFAFSGTNADSPWVDNGYTGTMFLSDGVTLAPYGELYATWNGDETLHARTAYIIHNLGTSFRMTDTSTMSQPQASDIYVRNATTEWGLLPAPETNHWYIISLNDGRRLSDSGGTLTLAPLGTTNSTVDWWFNGPNSSGYYYLENLALSQDIQGTGTAPAISFSMTSATSSKATEWRLVLAYDPVPIVTAVPPGSVSIIYSDSTATLSWTGNGSFYSVYRGLVSGGPYTNIAAAITNTSYLDSSVQDGTAYYYVVTALDILGVESSYSAEVVALPSSMTAVAINYGLGGGGLQLSWPPDHAGWRLLMDTNDLSIPGGWTMVPNSAYTNQVTVPFSLLVSNAYFQLTYP